MNLLPDLIKMTLADDGEENNKKKGKFIYISAGVVCVGIFFEKLVWKTIYSKVYVLNCSLERINSIHEPIYISRGN